MDGWIRQSAGPGFVGNEATKQARAAYSLKWVWQPDKLLRNHSAMPPTALMLGHHQNLAPVGPTILIRLSVELRLLCRHQALFCGGLGV